MRVAIFGVANDHSIAWAIAQRFHAAGAELALTYPNEAIEKRVRPLAESIGVDCVLPCDVTSDAEIAAVFATLRERWGELDAVVHSLAFAGRDELKGRYVDTSRQGFHLALDVSAYSLVAMARCAEPLLAPRRGAIVAMTYLGAERVIPHYNVMGIAKAALEASVRYLAWDLGSERRPRQRDLRRPHPDAVIRRHRRLQNHAPSPRGARAAPAQRHRR